MTNLHLADHYLLAIGLNGCSGKRNGSACSPDCLGHYSASSAADENQILLALPILPTVRKVVRGEHSCGCDLDSIEFTLYATGSVFLNDNFQTANVFATVIRDLEDGELSICLLPSIDAGLAEVGRVLTDFRIACRGCHGPAILDQR